MSEDYSDEFVLEDFRKTPTALAEHVIKLTLLRYPEIQVELREIKDLRSASRGIKMFLDFRRAEPNAPSS